MSGLLDHLPSWAWRHSHAVKALLDVACWVAAIPLAFVALFLFFVTSVFQVFRQDPPARRPKGHRLPTKNATSSAT